MRARVRSPGIPRVESYDRCGTDLPRLSSGKTNTTGYRAQDTQGAKRKWSWSCSGQEMMMQAGLHQDQDKGGLSVPALVRKEPGGIDLAQEQNQRMSKTKTRRPEDWTA